MRITAKIGLSLTAAALLVPWLPLEGQETVAIQRKPVVVATTAVSEDNEPWLGVYVSEPTMAVYAQLPKVPRGAGFVVDRVAKGGPADTAGVRQYDLLWKLDDQWLMNEGQFIALLGLRKVGDVVRLTYYRGGANHEVEATLTVRPEDEKGRHLADEAVFRRTIPGLPVQRVDLTNQVAMLRDGEETVRVQQVNGSFKWALFDAFGLEMASGELDGGDPEDFPPEMKRPLQGKLMVLIRSLENAGQHGGQGPRVRRLPGVK